MSLALDELEDKKKAIDCAKAARLIYEQIESPHAEKARQLLAKWENEGRSGR